jgi:hypothetical protein
MRHQNPHKQDRHRTGRVSTCDVFGWQTPTIGNPIEGLDLLKPK